MSPILAKAAGAVVHHPVDIGPPSLPRKCWHRRASGRAQPFTSRPRSLNGTF